MCNKSIENAKYVTETIYKSDDKFAYVQAVMNMELQAASRYTKIFCNTPEEQVENMKLALRSYEKVRSFVNQLKTSKNAAKDADVLNQDC